MQPTTGQINSGDENAPAKPADKGRTSRMRTIQPIHSDLSTPKPVLDILAADAAPPTKKTSVPQPLTQHSSLQAAPPSAKQGTAPLHDAALPHPVAPVSPSGASPSQPPIPVAPREELPLPEANHNEDHHEIDPLHRSVPTPNSSGQRTMAAPTTQPDTKSMETIAEKVLQQLQAKLAEAPASSMTEPANNPLPEPISSPPKQAPAPLPSTPAYKGSNPASAAPRTEAAYQAGPARQPAGHQTVNQSTSQAVHPPEHPPADKPHPKPAPQSPSIQSYALDKNDVLMRSSNPLAATLSGIELLIKRNGIASIAYVSIFLAITGVLLGSLYAAGRFLHVSFIAMNFSVIAFITLGVLLIATYMCSFVVCVASEAGQSLSLRQIFYLTRRNLHKLLALQILTIGATFIGLLFGIVPGVIVLGRWMMAPFMIFESDHPSIMTAIKRSNKLTKGRTVEMTGLVFTQVLLLSTGLLGFAAMAAGPAARYQQLRMRINDRTAITKVHFLNYIMSIFLALSLLGGMAGAGYQIYRANQSVCYSTIMFVEGRKSSVNVCVKRHACQHDIICRETIRVRSN